LANQKQGAAVRSYLLPLLWQVVGFAAPFTILSKPVFFFSPQFPEVGGLVTSKRRLQVRKMATVNQHPPAHHALDASY